MMLGDKSHGATAVHVPPWTFTADDPTYFPFSPNAANISGSFSDDYPPFIHPESLTEALQGYLPSNINDNDAVGGLQLDQNKNGNFLPVDAHTPDHFMMFEFKVRMCPRGRSHDWTDCPFAHPGEKAHRRDPRKFHYSGTACSDFRRGGCRKGDDCEFSHGVFECWLHPARYRTQPCKDGMSCERRICFFAHSPDQLRVLSPRPESYDVSARRLAFVTSPESVSPPVSPITGCSVDEMVASLRRLQLNKVNSMPSPWTSPRVIMNQAGFFSQPTTPTQDLAAPGIGYVEEPLMERVESGRELRAKMFEKLSKENPLDQLAGSRNG